MLRFPLRRPLLIFPCSPPPPFLHQSCAAEPLISAQQQGLQTLTLTLSFQAHVSTAFQGTGGGKSHPQALENIHLPFSNRNRSQQQVHICRDPPRSPQTSFSQSGNHTRYKAAPRSAKNLGVLSGPRTSFTQAPPVLPERRPQASPRSSAGPAPTSTARGRETTADYQAVLEALRFSYKNVGLGHADREPWGPEPGSGVRGPGCGSNSAKSSLGVLRPVSALTGLSPPS